MLETRDFQNIHIPRASDRGCCNPYRQLNFATFVGRKSCVNNEKRELLRSFFHLFLSDFVTTGLKIQADIMLDRKSLDFRPMKKGKYVEDGI